MKIRRPTAWYIQRTERSTVKKWEGQKGKNRVDKWEGPG